MSVLGPRAQSRSATLLIAVAVHGLILWAIWRVRVPVAEEVESFASVMFFLPQAVVPRTLAPAAPIASDARQASPAASQLQPAQSTTDLTLPATPGPPIDWSAQLASGARAELDLEEQARKQLELLQETTDEMGRNGCKKIVIVNGHGGNNSLLPYFAQSQLDSPKDFVVYIYQRGNYPPGRPQLKTKPDSHAGESETSGYVPSPLGHVR